MTTFTVTEARARLPALIDMVIAGQEIQITRHGRPVAVLVDPVSLSHRTLTPALRKAEQLRQLREELREGDGGPVGSLAPGRAEALVAGIRADRDAD